jgi:C_GCAxxG_C_C family probable redox protein
MDQKIKPVVIAENRAALAQVAAEKAREYELNFGACPQCVLAAIQETLGGDLIDDATIKAVHGLAGGGALTGLGACGALTGGLVALSAKRGRDRDKLDRGRFMGNYQKGKELVERFRAEFGGVTCEELQKQFTGRSYDMWKAEEYKAFDDARGGKCANATAMVTRWVVEML